MTKDEASLALLEDESEKVRYWAAWALGMIRSEGAVESLLVLLEDKSARVRARAAWALGLIGAKRAVESLLALLDDESGEVRANAVGALGLIGDERAVEGMLALLSRIEWWRFGPLNLRACDWAYGTVLKILAHHVADPGIVPQPPVLESDVIIGPWGKGLS